MKLAELQIDSFGIWRKLTLPLNENGLSLIYGPNGTGKSTLLEFIRGVLFGYSRESRGKLPAGDAEAGSLWIADAGQLNAISRSHDAAAGVDRVAVDGRGDEAATLRLQEILRGVTPELWDGVCCMGLNELQELSALSADQVAAQVYEATLGPAGRQVIAARRRREQDFAADGRQGLWQAEVNELLGRRDELTRLCKDVDFDQITELFAQRGRLQTEVLRLEGSVAQGRRRVLSLEYQTRIREPLARFRSAAADRERFASLPAFPEGGLRRLHELDQETRRWSARANRETARLARLRKHVPQAGLTVADAAALRSFVAQRGWYMEVARQRALAAQRYADHAARLQAAREQHAADWSDQALRGLDQSAEMEAALVRAGSRLKSTRRCLAHLRRLLHRTSARDLELQTSLRDGRRGIPTESIEAALDSTRMKLETAPQAAALRSREQLLQEHLRSLEPSQASLGELRPLPAWLSVAVAWFFFLGVVVAGWGFVAGVSTSALAGLMHVFLGLAFGGIAWGLKSQYEADRERQLRGDGDRRGAAERELESIRRQLQALPADTPATGTEPVGITRAAAAEWSRLSELSHVEREAQRLHERTRKLRHRLQQAREEYRLARVTWLDLLGRQGLAPSLEVEQILQGWRDLGGVVEMLRIRDELAAHSEALEQLWRAVETGVAELVLRSPAPQPTALDALTQIEQWRTLLAVHQNDLVRRRELRRTQRKVRRRLRGIRRRLQRIESERLELYRLAGVPDREAFLSLAAATDGSREAERRYQIADQELAQLRAESPELAALIDAGLVTDEQPNLQELPAAQRDLERLERELADTQDLLAEADLELEDRTKDPTAADLRLELELVEQQLQSTLQSLAALELAGQTFDLQSRSFERRTQPATLSTASALLARMTCDRYGRVWTPLGQRRLMVEDREGESHPVESLSRGTREQLYLSIRLAVIDRLANEGIEMPLLLDDVFVNFDHPRTEAGVELLREFADRGRQVLFLTCHPHLMQLFRDRGVEPIRLPGHTGGGQLDRRAG